MVSDVGIGDEGDGPVVLCLHGFPENASAFDEVARRLVAASFRVIRYDQRGYTDSTTSGSRCDYTVSRLAKDAIQVLDSCEIETCVVVGHDLGGLVAWELGRIAPERVGALVIVGVPHPAAFLLSLLGLQQAFRAWYFVLAQSTWLSSALYSPAKGSSRARFAARLAKMGLPNHQSERYLDCLAVGRCFVGAIRWYQAMPFASPASVWFRASGTIHILWGDADRLTVRLGIVLSRWFVSRTALRVTTVHGGSHWLVDQHPDKIVQAVVETTVVP